MLHTLLDTNLPPSQQTNLAATGEPPANASRQNERVVDLTLDTDDRLPATQSLVVPVRPEQIDPRPPGSSKSDTMPPGTRGKGTVPRHLIQPTDSMHPVSHPGLPTNHGTIYQAQQQQPGMSISHDHEQHPTPVLSAPDIHTQHSLHPPQPKSSVEPKPVVTPLRPDQRPPVSLPPHLAAQLTSAETPNRQPPVLPGQIKPDILPTVRPQLLPYESSTDHGVSTNQTRSEQLKQLNPPGLPDSQTPPAPPLLEDKKRR